jgi:hypothetical protein
MFWRRFRGDDEFEEFEGAPHVVRPIADMPP